MLGYATMEGVAFQMADCVAAQISVGVQHPETLMAVGGGTRSRLWMRLLATALGRPLALPRGAELAGPGGAARLAMAAASGDTAPILPRPALRETIDPDPGLVESLKPRKAVFDRLMASI